MLEFPAHLEKLILDYLKKAFLDPRKMKGAGESFNEKDFKYFSRGAGLLSEAYTVERETLPKNYFNDPVLRSGYLLYFLPVNYLKIIRIFEQFSPQELVSGKIRILDIGCGPGT